MSDTRIRLMLVAEAVVGGVKKHLLDLCAGLDKERFEITAVLAPGRDPSPDDTAQTLASLGVAHIPLDMRRSLSPGMLLRCRGRLRQVIAACSPHIVHAHSSIAGLTVRMAMPLRGDPRIVYTPHGLPFTMRTAGVMRWAYLQAERILGPRTHRLIAVCGSERDTAVHAGIIPSQRCVVIENGVARTPPPDVDRASVLSSLGLPPYAQMVLSVGDLRRQKGHETLIQALHGITARFDGVHVVIAGEGEQRPGLTRLAQSLGVADRVHLIGRADTVPSLLAACDLFCLPSLWEGCPYALVEAVLAGRPVVASAIPGIVDVVAHGHSAWLIPPGRPDALIGALTDALLHPEERRTRAARASKDIEGRFLPGQMLEQTAALYEELAGD